MPLGRTCWILLVALLSASLIGCATTAPSRHSALYFTPIDVETFAPLTICNIETDANCTLAPPRGEQIHEHLLALWRGGTPAAVTQSHIRLKLVTPQGNSIVVDQAGVIHIPGNPPDRQMPVVQRTSLDRQLRALAKSSGCKFA